MMLTGKCKEDFEKWYFKNHVKTTKKFKDLWPHEYHDIYDWFYGINLSFRYGVYVDFALFKGYILDVQPILNYDDEKYTEVTNWLSNIIELGKTSGFDMDDSDTLDEARKRVVKKFDELYNERR